MDANKRLKLVDIGYEIRPTCMTCSSGRFENAFELFGTCRMHEYVHLKHSQSKRELSVFRAGSCRDFEPNPGTDSALHGFKEFVK